MLKFGLFAGNVEQRMQTYEGNRIVTRDAEYVDVVVGTGQNRKVVATIRLEKGQSVKELK
jgi:hypothetical protein